MKVLTTATSSIIILPESFLEIRRDLIDLIIDPFFARIALAVVLIFLIIGSESNGNYSGSSQFFFVFIVISFALPLTRFLYTFLFRRDAFEAINGYEIEPSRKIVRVVFSPIEGSKDVYDIQRNCYLSMQSQKIESATDFGFARNIELSIEVREDLISEDGLDSNNFPVSTVCRIALELDNEKKIPIECNSLDVSSHPDNQKAFREFISANHESVEQIKIFLAATDSENKIAQ